MNEELEQITRDMRRKERELWAGNPPRMGNGAVALMRPWAAYIVAAAVVVALLALPGIIMAVAGWLTGGAR